jgi:hypothetical protein
LSKSGHAHPQDPAPDNPLQRYRSFPNQDTMPKGGFGNLIALPLQKVSRENGCSVFVDAHLHPYHDQWAFHSLGSVNE